MADIVGALDIRQKRLDADEQKRKEIRMGQLIAEATPNLIPGSTLDLLARESPKEYMVLAKHIGIPLNAGDQMQEFANDTGDLYIAAQADPSAAYHRAIELKQQRNAQGRATPTMDKFIAGFEDDPKRTLTGLFVTHRTLNPTKQGEGFTLGDTRYDSAGNVIATNPRAVTEGDQSTANAKDLRTYKELVDKNDPTAEQFGQMIGMIPKENKKLSPFAEKEIGKASDEYTVAINSANRFKALSSKLENSAIHGGVKGTWGEWIKEQTGNQDELTALRKEALQIASSEAINNLPPGAASESDVKMAREPLPTEKSDPKYVAKWLASIGRLREKEAEFHQFKADFISKNDTLRTKEGKSLATAWKEFQSGDSQKQAPVQPDNAILSAPTQASTQPVTAKETAAQRYARLKGGN